MLTFIEPVEVVKQIPVIKPDAEVVPEKPVEKVCYCIPESFFLRQIFVTAQT